MLKNKHFFINQLDSYKKSGLLISALFDNEQLFIKGQNLNLSYSEFWLDVQNKILRLSHVVKDHKRIAISVSNPEHYLKMIFALWTLGKSVVALSDKMPELEITNKMAETNTTFLIDDSFDKDFDANNSKEQCLSNVLKNAVQGSIVVFHDSMKAWEKLEYTLPKVLAHFSNLGYRFEALSEKMEGVKVASVA